jgi:hypothetical protein
LLLKCCLTINSSVYFTKAINAINDQKNVEAAMLFVALKAKMDIEAKIVITHLVERVDSSE